VVWQHAPGYWTVVLCDSDFALTMGYTALLIETANYELSGRVIIIDDDGGYGQ